MQFSRPLWITRERRYPVRPNLRTDANPNPRTDANRCESHLTALIARDHLGPAHRSTPRKVYGHLMPDQEDRTWKVIEAVWRAMDGQEAASP